MKYLIFLLLTTTQVLAADKLDDFNRKLMENFDKDVKNENDLSIRKNRGPARGPASVAPERIQEEKKIDKSIRQNGLQDW